VDESPARAVKQIKEVTGELAASEGAEAGSPGLWRPIGRAAESVAGRPRWMDPGEAEWRRAGSVGNEETNEGSAGKKRKMLGAYAVH
jgi:hypothetical protein